MDLFEVEAYYPDWKRVVESRVEAGAKWMDKNEPGWFNKIPIEELEMEDGERCICGWVFKDMTSRMGYYYWIDKYAYNDDYGNLTPVNLGFLACEGFHQDCEGFHQNERLVSTLQEYSHLAESWILQIEKRRADSGTALEVI